MAHDHLLDDPYGYNNMPPIYSVNVDLGSSGFELGQPTLALEDFHARHQGQLFVVATPDAIYGPFSTRESAEALLDEPCCDRGDSLVFQLSNPEAD